MRCRSPPIANPHARRTTFCGTPDAGQRRRRAFRAPAARRDRLPPADRGPEKPVCPTVRGRAQAPAGDPASWERPGLRAPTAVNAAHRNAHAIDLRVRFEQGSVRLDARCSNRAFSPKSFGLPAPAPYRAAWRVGHGQRSNTLIQAAIKVLPTRHLPQARSDRRPAARRNNSARAALRGRQRHHTSPELANLGRKALNTEPLRGTFRASVELAPSGRRYRGLRTAPVACSSSSRARFSSSAHLSPGPATPQD